jgi:putative ABC transport system substrate-binding protein
MRAKPYQTVIIFRRVCTVVRDRLIVAFLIVCGMASSARGAGEVLIVKSSDAEPYQQAEAAVRDELTRQHYSIRASSLNEITQSGAAAAAKHAVAVLAVGTPAAKFLHVQLPPAIPLTYCMVSSPQESGLSQGRESCGVTTDVPLAEQMKIISEALPQARAIGFLYRGDNAEGKMLAQEMRKAAPAGWRVEPIAVNEFSSVAAAITALTQKKPDIIWTAADSRLYDTAAVRALLLSALRSKIPVWGFSPAFVRAGGLVGIGVDPKAQGKQAAALLVNLLEQPSNVGQRVQGAREYQIAVNLIVARQLGVQVPEELSRKAAFVFRGEN